MLVGRRGDAAERLLKFVETREGRNEWRAHRSLGDLFIDEFPRLAQTHYERAAALKPNDPNILLGQSVCAARLGRSDEAIQLARAATTADGGTSVKFVAHLSGILRAAGEWADALEYARRALRLATEAAGTRSGDEAALRTLDAQYQALIETLQSAIAAEDTPASQSYMDLAEALRRRFDVQQKLNLLNVLRVMETAVAETAPNSPPFLLEHHAVTLAELGRTDQAVEAFERLRSVDPNNPLIAEWMLRLKTHSPPGSPGE
jgi:tetratricopeptide (TPR) repeat protein